jgi:hypothetical protein
MLVKYFSEKVAPGVHDVAAKRESFGVWKEELIHAGYAKLAASLHEEHAATLKDQLQAHHEHRKTRADMLVKYSTAQNVTT